MNIKNIKKMLFIMFVTLSNGPLLLANACQIQLTLNKPTDQQMYEHGKQCVLETENTINSNKNLKAALAAKKAGLPLNFQPKQVVSMENQVFTHINMEKIDLSATTSAPADFSGADFSVSSLYQIHLDGANLQGALFKQANLKQAYLMGADLRGADFTGADLESTNFTGAIYSSTTKGISSSLIAKFNMILQADEVQAVQ